MPSRDSAKAALKRFIHQTEEAKYEYGYLGRLNSAGTAYEFWIPEKPGFAYCLIERSPGTLEHAECLPRVAFNPRMRCKFRTVRGALVAFEYDPLEGATLYGDSASSWDLPSYPPPEGGAIPPAPTFGDPVVKLLDEGVASTGDDRYLLLAAESGTADDCDGLTGLAVGDEAWLFADTGDTITLKHNSGSVTDKFQFYNEADIVISATKGLRVMKRASGAIVNSVDALGSGGALPSLGGATVITLASDVAAAGSDRHLVLAAQSSTSDNLIEITGLSVGDEVIVRADAGDTITVKHNDSGATDKILLYGAADLVLSGDHTLKLVKIESGKVVQYVDQSTTGGSGSGAPDIILEDQKSANTAGGGFTSGSDQTRTLNTEVRDVNNDCTLSSNQFTLATGTYYSEIIVPAAAVNRHQAVLYNVTAAADVVAGTSAYSASTVGDMTHSFISGVFTIASPAAFEVRHRCQTTKNTDGFGVPSNFGRTERYTVAKFWKLA